MKEKEGLKAYITAELSITLFSEEVADGKEKINLYEFVKKEEELKERIKELIEEIGFSEYSIREQPLKVEVEIAF